MGEYYIFGSPERKERIELPHATKLSEISGFDSLLIINYLRMHACRQDLTVTFVGDEYDSRSWDKVYEEWEDVTAEVLYNLLERV